VDKVVEDLFSQFLGFVSQVHFKKSPKQGQINAQNSQEKLQEIEDKIKFTQNLKQACVIVIE